MIEIILFLCNPYFACISKYMPVINLLKKTEYSMIEVPPSMCFHPNVYLKIVNFRFVTLKIDMYYDYTQSVLVISKIVLSKGL